MAAAPLLTGMVPRFCDWLGQGSWFGEMFHDSPPEDDIDLTDHVIIAGFGINGRSLATALAEFGVPHVILELNPETVRSESALGIDIRYGDCTRRPILEHAGIFRARAFVVAISDPASARRSVRVARDLVPGDRWCLCAARWLEAMREGCAPQVVLEATSEKALDVVPFEILKQYSA